MQPLFITFDTNAYDKVVSPNLWRLFQFKPFSKERRRVMGQRIAGAYIAWCIRQRRIYAAIAEAALKAEVLPNVDRVAFLKSVYQHTAPPPVNISDNNRVRKALAMGFKVLHGARIGYGQLIGVDKSQWAGDLRHIIGDRQQRFGTVLRSFNDSAFTALQTFGEQLAALHAIQPALSDISAYAPKPDPALWIKGLEAEEQHQKKYTSLKAFHKALQQHMADWADFDIACAHHAYDFDYLCTADAGKTHATSVFGAGHAAQLNQFGVKTLTLPQLAQLCWRRYRFPLTRWPSV